MGYKVLVFFVLIFLKGLYALTLVPSANPVPVGTNVTISLNDSLAISFGAWLFGPSILFVWSSGVVVKGSGYVDGITFNNSSYMLTLSSVNLKSSGIYVVEVMGANTIRGEVYLDVQEPVSNVELNVSKSNLVELNDSVTFTCSARGTPLWVTWQNGSSAVTAGGRVALSSDGQVLTINAVTRYDQGPFMCVVANSISRQESTQINLAINYGPSSLTLTVSPERVVYVSGTVIYLSCSSDSKPSASFFWTYNDVPLNVSGPNLTLMNTAWNKTGQYGCIAYNEVTLRYATVTKNIRIVDPISEVMVNPQAGYPIENMPFSLTCQIVGSMGSIQWMKNSMYLSSNGITLSNQNLTLSFNQLSNNDNGQYQCVASNAVNNMTSVAYNLMVNYGPRNVAISGQDVTSVGSNVTFNCTADSQPQSQYSWYFKGQKVADRPVYITEALSVNSSGQYTCMAFNNITDKSSNASMELSVIVPVRAVTVNPDNQQPLFNQSFTLNCTVSGDVASVQWMKNGVRLYPNSRTTFSSDNLTFSFNQLTFDDGGLYQCAASNPVSSMTSLVYNLTVIYGPWNTTISGPAIEAVGSNVTFSCSAYSYPPSQYSWFFNGLKVADGSVYVMSALTINNRGQYMCMAFNNVTRSSNNASVELTIIIPISDIMVSTGNNQEPVFNQSFTLNCNVSGDVASVQWMKNGVQLYPNNRTTFSSDNLTFSFNQLTFDDGGLYQCAARNPVSSMTSLAYYLTVNYGPWNTTISGPAVGAVGSNVTFSCSAISYPPSQYSWFFSGLKMAEGSIYVMRDLTISNRGQYMCMAFNNITRSSNNASVELSVFNSISNVTVNPVNQQPVLDQSFTLNCNVSGDVAAIQWMKNGVQLYPNNRTTFSSDNLTFSFNQLTVSDNGLYQCAASNPVSSMTSLAYNLAVIYGPWNTTISGPAVGAVGSNVAFSCSASSYPPSQYSWFFGGLKVTDGWVYVMRDLTINNSGQYTCMAFNNITRSSNNASMELTVFYPISAVTVNTGNQQPVYDKVFNLTCNVSGDVSSIQWMKNRVQLDPNNRITYYNNNSTLSFNLLALEDDGEYQCAARNPVSNMNSLGYNVTVNYGPLSTTITGPSGAETGSNVTFNCSARSHPQSLYSWFFNGSQVASSSLYVIENITLNNTGEFTCLAFNNITGNTNIGKWTFTVYEKISSVHVVSNPLIPQASENLQLMCHVDGPYDSLYWLRNNKTLQQSDRVKFTDNNATVNFTPLRTIDNGYYQCVATNIFRPHESQPYGLVASFGPLNVQILVKPGYITTLTCKAESQPPAVYQWSIDNNIVVNTSSINVSLTNILNNNYTCMARNPLTNVTVYTSHFINEPDAAVSVHSSMMLTALLALLLLTMNECL